MAERENQPASVIENNFNLGDLACAPHRVQCFVHYFILPFDADFEL